MRLHRRGFLVLSAAGAAAVGNAPAASAAAPRHDALTQRLYLTGQDADHPVDWDFLVTHGRRAGEWGTIPTPSNWEFHGYGTYTYGWNPTPEEKGRYRHTFTPPASWRGRRVLLVFEGSMTDTRAWVNGRPAGPVHQGGFYRFRYDVTDLLDLGAPNLLEVTVSKDSADPSVNRAEREADYWIFGGIYRPVHLEAVPAERIDHLAVDARADGRLALRVALDGAATADRLVARVLRRDGRPLGAPFTTRIAPGATAAALTAEFDRPALWTAETPHLHQVEVSLRAGSRELHRVRETFGFRTVEVRPGDGVYVNGVRTVFKGACRHSFWPDSGRATGPRVSRLDIALMKRMNMNAVRMSHYPPDTHFLDLCDEAGLYVIDELAGWQGSYSEAAGAPLVAEMVARDVNHPCVLFWANGNEGGWNTALDDDYALHDPQRRPVLHPWATFGGINTDHYENYDSTRRILREGADVFMPTEFLHGLYDGGAGAGLNDYWKLMGRERLSAGGFLWALIDEGVVRDDRGGAIDVAGNSAPDGILGPYREQEASFHTIREIWSPVEALDAERYAAGLPADFDGRIRLANHHGFTDTRRCRFTWRLLVHTERPGRTVRARGTAAAPGIAPGAEGELRLDLPPGWRGADTLALTAADPSGRELMTWTWPITTAADHARRMVRTGPGPAVRAASRDGALVLTAGGTRVTLDPATGMLAGATGTALAGGPRPAHPGDATLTRLTHGPEGDGYAVTAELTGGLSRVRWLLHPSGWLRLDYRYDLTGEHPFFGVTFDHPESAVTGLTWLGRGPYGVWRNRMRGLGFDVWSKRHNDTATGADGWQYPEFKGHHADVRWARLHTTAGTVTMVAGEDGLFLRVLTPRYGPDPRHTAPPFPPGDISFLDAIPPIGTKFDPPEALGPEGRPNPARGTYRRTVYLRFEE
ncbi:glycoside hydrolase family 2 [Streptomyces capparidis]